MKLDQRLSLGSSIVEGAGVWGSIRSGERTGEGVMSSRTGVNKRRRRVKRRGRNGGSTEFHSSREGELRNGASEDNVSREESSSAAADFEGSREKGRLIRKYLTKLQEIVPLSRKDKRLSKLEVITNAIDYIRELRETLGLAPGTLPSSWVCHDSAAFTSTLLAPLSPLQIPPSPTFPNFNGVLSNISNQPHLGEQYLYGENSQERIWSSSLSSPSSPDSQTPSSSILIPLDALNESEGVPAVWTLQVPCNPVETLESPENEVSLPNGRCSTSLSLSSSE